VDKLIKIGKGIWDWKERVLLAVALIVLVFLVWRVVKKSGEGEELELPPAPSTILPEGNSGDPPPPMRRWPRPPAFGEYRPFINRNLWWWDAVPVQRGGPDAPEGPEVVLTRVLAGRAYLKVDGKRSRPLQEGDSFKGVSVLSIDKDAKTCEVEIEATSRTIILE